MTEFYRMALDSVESAVSQPNRVSHRLAIEMIVNCLEREASCSDEIFHCIIVLLKMDENKVFESIGNLVFQIMLFRDLFTECQRQTFVNALMDIYSSTDMSENRMQICAYITNAFRAEAAATILLTLLRNSRALNRPLSEVLWELSGIRNDPALSYDTKKTIVSVIRHIEPECS